MEDDTNVVIKKTSFIYEDGNVYYFDIKKRTYGNDYHDLFVYELKEFTEEVVTKRDTWYGLGKPLITTTKIAKEKYVQLNKDGDLISSKLEVDDVKRVIKRIITHNKTVEIKGWDGFVGNIPEDMKKALSRDNKLNNLFKK